MRPGDLLRWLSTLPPGARDAVIEDYLGIASPDPSASPPGEHLVGYHASGVAPIVHAILEVPIVEDDVVVDLGAGLGKFVFLVKLLTGATARGIELQPELVERARAIAARLAIDVSFVQADVRNAPLDDGTVFFLYAPFTGPVLAEVLDRLHSVAAHRSIVVCALGVDAERGAPWLVRRPLDSFWLTISDSDIAGIPPRAARARASARLERDLALDIAMARR